MPQILYKSLKQAENEWSGVSDIVQLSFKAACHVLKAQSECLKEMEQILPAKANKQDVSTQLAAKANLFDIKSTMAEVAANIESKVSLEEFRQAIENRLSREELSVRLQERVSFDDMKRYVALNGGTTTSGETTNGAGPTLANR